MAGAMDLASHAATPQDALERVAADQALVEVRVGCGAEPVAEALVLGQGFLDFIPPIGVATSQSLLGSAGIMTMQLEVFFEQIQRSG